MRVASWLCVIWMMLPSSASGQVADADVAAAGVVVDTSGGVVPGAVVDLTPLEPGSGGDKAARHTTTDSVGHFKFEHVRAGRYVVRAVLDGFDPATVQLTVSAPRAPAAVRLVLAVAGVVQSATVTASSLQADLGAAGNLDTIAANQAMLEDLPVFDQDYIALMSRFLDASAIGTSGVGLVVDGAEANSVGVTPSAIQQIKINQDPYSAEFSRPGRGRIEVITKAGTDAFHGTANAIFRDASLAARDPFATVKTPDQKRIVEGYLGGPIGDGKRASFVTSASRIEQDGSAFVHAVGLGGLVQGVIANPTRETDLSGSMSFQKSDKTTMTFRGSYEADSQAGARAGGLTLPEGAVHIDSGESQLFLTVNTIISSQLLHQTAVRYGQEFDDIVGLSKASRVVVQDSFIGGGAQQDWLRTEHHVTLTDAFTWTRGHHTIKAGLNIPDWSRRRFDDNTNTAGTFYFSNLTQYAAGLPYAFIQQQGNGHQAFLERVLGVFAQDEMQVTPDVTVTLGLRYYWQNYFHDDNNFAPRGSIAWAPFGTARTIVRGGAGVFYDRSGPLVINDLLTSRAGLLRRYVITDPGYPDPLGPGQSLDEQPSNVVQLAPAVHIPSTLQYSVGLERQVGRATTVSVTYTGMRGHSLFLSRDINAPIPPLYDGRPDPDLGVVRQIESTGRLTSQSLQVMLRGHVTRTFNGQLQYTFGRALNNTSGVNWFPANDYDLSGEWSRADFDRVHAFEGVGTFRLGGATQFGVAASLSTGKPYSLLAGEDLYGNARGTARPAGVPRNSLTGPGYANVDLRLSHDITLRARPRPNDAWTLTVGVDAFNVLNHTNFTSYIGTVTSPLFGQATSAQPPRRVQFSLRTKF
jgi:outer membrane receptor protein involved in Fe transport